MLIVVFFASLDMTGFTFRSAPIPSANILRLKTLIRGLSVTTETKATKNHWPPKARCTKLKLPPCVTTPNIYIMPPANNGIML